MNLTPSVARSVRRPSPFLAFLIGVGLVLATPALRAQSFEGLGFLPGGSSSFAFGVSADGSVVVGSSTGDGGNREPFRWTEGAGMQGLGLLPGGIGGEAHGVSADGAVVVGYTRFFDSGNRAFRWTEGGGMQSLGVLPGHTDSQAHGVSADGDVIVGSSWSGPEDGAFRWTASGGMQDLGHLDGYSKSWGHGVSADGSTAIGYSSDWVNDEAFRWTVGAGMQGLGDLPGGSFESYANGVSADGTVIVGHGHSGGGTEAFRWTESGGMQGLGDFPGGNFESYAWGVSADGAVVVGRGTTGIGGEAFLWTVEAGLRPLKAVLEDDHGLDLTGWRLSNARGVSADGTVVVGDGINPQGQPEAWRAVLLPTARWLDPVSGFFNEPTRWSILDVPGEQHGALFDAPSEEPYTVTFVQSQTTRALAVDESRVRLDLGGATYTLAHAGPGPALTVDGTDEISGWLEIGGGTLAARDAVVGAAAGSLGLIAFGDDGGTLTLSGTLTVGGAGWGAAILPAGSTVTIREGLVVGDLPGGEGEVHLGGVLQVTDGTLFNAIGLAGDGELSVGAGGFLSLAGETVIGSTADGGGMLHLYGGGVGITQDTLTAGLEGTGLIHIEEGAHLTSVHAVLAHGSAIASSLVRVEGPGSRWDLSGTLILGRGGFGWLSITNGGAVTVGERLVVGPRGLLEADGGMVCVGVGCGDEPARGGPAVQTPVLLLAEGAAVVADALLLDFGGTLGGHGSLTLPLANAGTLEPGGAGAAGPFGVGGDYAQTTDGRLRIELGGLAAGVEYDQLTVAGTAVLGGTLELVTLGAYIPEVNDTFVLVRASAVEGTFAAVDAPSGVGVELAYTATEVVAKVVHVSVDGESSPDLTATGLYSASPNPFNESTTIRYDMVHADHVRLAVFDLLGREMVVLVDDLRQPGTHEARLRAEHLASGVYFVRMATLGGVIETLRITVAR